MISYLKPEEQHQHKNGGGWVANTAHVEDTAYIGPDARVSGGARVYGSALVYGNAWISGDAQVCGSTQVSGGAQKVEKRSVFSYSELEVFYKIYAESTRARAKHGDAPQASEIEVLSILMEEVGEIATALNQNQPKADLEKEIVQCASVCFRWLTGDLTYSRKP